MNGNSILSKLAVLLIAALCALYFGTQVVKMLSDPVEIVRAVYAQVDQTITAEGCFIRDEQVISGRNSGSAVFSVPDGGRLSKGEDVAVYYKNSNAAEVSRQLSALQKRIDDYEYVIAQSQDKPDTVRSNEEIISLSVNAERLAKDEIAVKSLDGIEDLKSALVRRSLIYGDLSGVNSRLKDLKNRKKQLQAELKNVYSTVTTPCSGYFCRTVDGYEQVLTEDLTEQMTPEMFDKLRQSQAAVSENAIGKISKNFYWYFAVCLDGEQFEEFKKFGLKGTTLRFSQLAVEDISVRTYKMNKQEDGGAVVIFRGTQDSAELLAARYQPVEIVLKTHEGVKIPKTALRQVDGEWGVYCMSGRLSVFKKVESAYETENYILVESSGEKSSEVYIYDEIIVSGKGIADKQVVE